MQKGHKGRIKIIGGLWRGRWLDVENADDLRPTPNRVRETLFNWLGQILTQRRCLDLFSGSGALGIEALSRGAERVVFVEQHKKVVEGLKANLHKLKDNRALVVCADSWQWINHHTEMYDIIFLDPPFFKTDYARLLELVKPRLLPQGVIYCESPREMTLSDDWVILKQAFAGQVQYQLIQPK